MIKVVRVVVACLTSTLLACSGVDEGGSGLSAVSFDCDSSSSMWQPVSGQDALEKAVYNYSVSQINKKVPPRGECADLAVAAIQTAGGKPWYALTPAGSKDYVWGKLLTTVTSRNRTVSGVRPGDIIQFSKTVFTNGSTEQHTAVVAKVSRSGDRVCVLQSNANNVKLVKYGTFPFADLKSGTMKFYRPIK